MSVLNVDERIVLTRNGMVQCDEVTIEADPICHSKADGDT
jgi:hypothetical protein